MATNFEPRECVVFVQSTKIGTHENKSIQSILIFMELKGMWIGMGIYYGKLYHIFMTSPLWLAVGPQSL